MDVQPSNGATPSAQGNTQQSSGAGDAGSPTISDYDTFLDLFMTQIENQDPLEPMDSSDLTEQLATFSSVEQAVLTNDLLEELIAETNSSNLTQLADWVGMEARVSGEVYFDGSQITLVPEPDAGSDAAFLVVRDSAGEVVSREELPLDGEPITWVGVADDGDLLPNGAYSFEVESKDGDVVTNTAPVDAYMLVQEAKISGNDVELVLKGGRSIASTEVGALRTPQPVI